MELFDSLVELFRRSFETVLSQQLPRCCHGNAIVKVCFTENLHFFKEMAFFSLKSS